MSDTTLPAELDAAIARFEGFLRRDPENIGLTLDLGDLYHKRGRVADASACFQKCLELEPTNPIAKSRLAAACITQQDFARAETLLTELLAAGEKDPAVVYNLGMATLYQERWEEARKYFEVARAAGLDAARCVYRITQAYHRQGDLPKAVESCEEWARLTDDSPEAKGYLGLIHMDAGQMPQAKELATETLRRDPNNIDAGIVAGSAEIEEQNIERANALFKRISERDPRNPRGWLGLGLVHLYRAEFTQAIPTLEKAIALMPKFAGAYIALGWAKLANRDMVGGEKVFRRALEAERNFAEAHGGLAYALAMQGRIDEANAEIQAAQWLDSGSFSAAAARAAVLGAQGKRERAVNLLSAMLEQSPVPGQQPLIEHIRRYLQKHAPNTPIAPGSGDPGKKPH